MHDSTSQNYTEPEEESFDCVSATKYLQEYMNTYDKQIGYDKYKVNTFTQDVLYGLGVAIDKRYRFANGFMKFKKELYEQLKEEFKSND